MLIKKGKGDYPRVYRPYRPQELYGQEQIKQIITKSFKDNTIAHVYLFHGISGTGKTTCARIIAMGLMCEHGPNSTPCGECQQCRAVIQTYGFEYREINNANLTGVEFARKIREDFQTRPMNARCKVFVFDECHRMSEASQNMLLKEVEDAPDFIYFIFCSTDPKKIIEPLKNRCMPIEFKRLEDIEIQDMLADVCELENIVPIADVMNAIVKEAQGRPRNALLSLQKAVAAGELQKLVPSRQYLIRMAGLFGSELSQKPDYRKKNFI